MDEQRRLPGPPGSFPPGATPPTVSWSERPTFDAAGVPASRIIPDSGVVWPGRRTLSRTERVLVCVGAVALVGYLGVLCVVAWREQPVVAALSALLGSVGVVWLAASAWEPRPNRILVRGWPLRRLPRDTRRALVADLRGGRLGPPELRPYAVTWVCQRLQAPWTPGLLLVLLTNGVANTVVQPGPLTWWRVLLLVVVLAITLAGGTSWLISRRTARPLADTLDQLTPPGPHPLPDPA